jgi:hypothetical protein
LPVRVYLFVHYRRYIGRCLRGSEFQQQHDDRLLHVRTVRDDQFRHRDIPGDSVDTDMSDRLFLYLFDGIGVRCRNRLYVVGI